MTGGMVTSSKQMLSLLRRAKKVRGAFLMKQSKTSEASQKN